MNETLDYTEDKTTRGANKKRKEMEKSPFYNIYTSVDLTPQEAFDMDVKLEWVCIFYYFLKCYNFNFYNIKFTARIGGFDSRR